MANEMLGQIFKTNDGSKCVIDKFDGCMKVTVRFLDKFSYTTTTDMSKLRKGSVKNPYARSVFNVGFIGFGLYKCSDLHGVTLEYRAWKDMLRRCYDKNFQGRQIAYVGCSVHPDWHNFQIFAEWYTNHESYGLGYHLDKDLLIKGNKVYSANSCLLLPKEINSLLPDSEGIRGKNPQGVSYHKRSGRFVAHVSRFGSLCFLGYFDKPEEAFKVFKIAKEGYVKEVAVLWRDKISKDVFDKLMGWELKNE